MERVTEKGVKTLNLSFVQDRSKGLSTMIKEPDSEFSSLATLGRSTRHFPGLSGSRHFHSTFRTFSHLFHLPFTE